MARKARTHFAILGLLCWKPMSGYDIKKMVEVALTYFWSESYGQIFPVLNRLIADGLATKQLDPASGGRRRQVYTVTQTGRETFRQWLEQVKASGCGVELVKDAEKLEEKAMANLREAVETDDSNNGQ